MNANEWKISYVRPEVPEEFKAEGYSRLLSLILCQRGIRSKQELHTFINGGPEILHDPFLLTDMEKAVDRIHRAILSRETVAVYGDYDVDGITSTCLVADYLRSKGMDIVPYIPVREDEGYGLKSGAIDLLSKKNVKLIITVDCGITAVAETEHARELGIDVIITDHHECGSNGIPQAVAVVDCKRPDDLYPNKCLAGVGMALKLVCACEGFGHYTEVVDRYCDLVAIGTVADVMLLLGENRYLVRHGLDLINDPRVPTRPGIAALVRNDKDSSRLLTASGISYSLAPVLNAAGRLLNAITAVELLMTENVEEADQIVAKLNDLNEYRKTLGDQIWSDAVAQIGPSVPDTPIVLCSDIWHQGVIGIVASRLSEKYHLPSVLICFDGENGKGSCRSYGDFNLFTALSSCSDHLIGFGGHMLAAGLNIKRSNVDSFRRALTEYYLSNKPSNTSSTICDVAIYDPSLLSRRDVEALELLEPYGSGNMKPVMCISDVIVTDILKMGKDRQHLKLGIDFKGRLFEAVCFSYTTKFDITDIFPGSHVDLAFTPQINSFHGKVSVQLIMIDLKLHSGREIARELLRGNTDASYFYTKDIPDRTLLGYVWKAISSWGGMVPSTLSELTSRLQQLTRSVSLEQFCIALTIFRQAGLLECEPDHLLGSRQCRTSEKCDPFATPVYRLLTNINL